MFQNRTDTGLNHQILIPVFALKTLLLKIVKFLWRRHELSTFFIYEENSNPLANFNRTCARSSGRRMVTRFSEICGLDGDFIFKWP